MEKTILLSNGFSGINLKYYELLKITSNTTYIGCEVIDFGMFHNSSVPTYISDCPYCENKVKWRTTGLIPLSLKCEKCNGEFKPW